MFNALRRTIANLVNPVDKVAQAKLESSLAYQDAINDKDAQRKAQKAAYLARQQQPTIVAPKIVGNISGDVLDQMQSTIGKDAIIQLAAWSSLSNAFNTYNKIRSSKRKNEKLDALFYSHCNAFHAWNARLSSAATGIDVEEIVARLTVPRTPRSNEQTDAILARIKGKSVTELALDREIKAELASKEAEANASGFMMELEGFAYGSDEVPELKASMVLAKAEDTLLWLAGWSTPDVAELLVLEQDILMLRKAAETHRENEGDFIDGSMAVDTLCRMNSR